MAKFLQKNKIKTLKKLKTKELREKLLEIKGIGNETADSIMLYAFEKPVFVIDAYTRRIFSRLGLCKKDASYEELQKLFMKNLPKNAKLFNEYHALLVEHAKRFCKTKKECDDCLLNIICHSQV